MADSDNKNGGIPASHAGIGLRDGGNLRETLLLSDLPEAPLPAAPETSTPTSANLNLSTNALAALGQRYEILASAGNGSMGNVFKARDRETGETVALKLLKPEIASDQAMMDRFKNELLFARKITHKNVCRVYEFNRLAGIAYTSMEFVEGESLRSVLNRFGALTQRKATDLALQICSGLKEAHAQGIVHRDLKPENVMIDTSGNLKIMDFGIARSMEAVTRQTGTMVGTPAYMAPEQVSGSPVDYRTDIYSLGLMLYEMFTGNPAFTAENAIAVALKQMREAPPPPHDIDPSIPAPIERAILKCLEKSPDKRFQTVAELEAAVQSFNAPPNAARPAAAAAAAFEIRSAAPVLASPVRLRPSSPRTPTGVPRFVWILVGVFLVLGALTTLRAFAITRAAQEIPPPPAPSLPVPPAFAYEIPAATPEADAADSSAQPTKPGAEKSATPATVAPATKPKSSPAEVFPRMEIAPKRNHPDPSKWIAAERAREQKEKKSGAAAPFDSVYLRTGHFFVEQEAQDQVKKIRALGFPAKVKTWRRLKGNIYVVLCGPFAAGGAQAVAAQLKTAGFTEVSKVSAASVQ
ncbi:MAG TPA: protein kinase [Candidatus Acidoferrales bacterium]